MAGHSMRPSELSVEAEEEEECVGCWAFYVENKWR